MSDPVQLDMSTAQPLPTAITLDMNTAVPLNGAPPSPSLDLKNASTIPNARIRNLPNPAAGETSAAGALYHGMKAGATLGMLPTAPAALSMGAPRLIGSLVGGVVGNKGGQFLSKLGGANPLQQEVSGDIGGAIGGLYGSRGLGIPEFIENLKSGFKPPMNATEALSQIKAGASVQIPGGAANTEIPVQGKPVQPPFPGPKNYEVTRGADPFTHPNAPSKWQFDQDYSSNVKQYGYHPDSQTISVMYKRGGVYQFKATPQQYNQMLKAPSAGGYLHDVIEPSQTRGAGTHVGTVTTGGQK